MLLHFALRLFLSYLVCVCVCVCVFACSHVWLLCFCLFFVLSGSYFEGVLYNVGY